MTIPSAHISICVCTYRRPEMLGRLLEVLRRLRTDGLFSYSVVVVDNDDRQSAREVVDRAGLVSAVPITYDVEPERSISLARNRSVRNASGDLIAFIDDDEFPHQDWLLNHMRTLRRSGADGTLGPVRPHFDADAPVWLVKSGLCDRTRFATGTILNDPRHTRTGNALVRASLFKEPGAVFDPRYGRSGGGDAVFFKRMMQRGKVFVWCDEAAVFEVVPPERHTRSYYLKRALTRGMAEAWETRFLSASTLRSLAAILAYSASLPLLLLAGQHRFMKYAVKDCDHLGKVLSFLGVNVVAERPYAASALDGQATERRHRRVG